MTWCVDTDAAKRAIPAAGLEALTGENVSFLCSPTA